MSKPEDTIGLIPPKSQMRCISCGHLADYDVVKNKWRCKNCGSEWTDQLLEELHKKFDYDKIKRVK